MGGRERGAVGLPTVWAFVAITLVGAGVGTALGTRGDLSLVGESSVVPSLDPVSFFDCPAGTALGELHRGDRVFVVGRNEAGDWLAVRSPFEPSSHVWLLARYLNPDHSVSHLPVLQCHEARVAVGGHPLPTTTTTTFSSTSTTRTRTSTTAGPPGSTAPTTGPRATTTGPRATTTGKPSGTTTTLDHQGPTIDLATPNPTDIWKESPSVCGDKPKTTTISAVITDPSGISEVTVSWTYADEHGDTSGTMSRSGSTYSRTLGRFIDADLPSGTLTVSVSVHATDSLGNTRASSTTFQLHDADECFG